jgi:hypothetical protein
VVVVVGSTGVVVLLLVLVLDALEASCAGI